MATANFLDLTGLSTYDSLIKNYIDLADTKAYKTILLVDKTVKFYKKENATSSDVADFSFTMSETDVSNLLEKLSGATENNVVVVGANGTVKDGGTLLSDLATKTYVGEEIAKTTHLTKEIVATIPEVADAKENIIYMIKDDSISGDDKYNEYMLIDGAFVKIGDTSIDLSGYVKTSDISTISTEQINALFTS